MMKPSPSASASSLRRFFSIARFLKGPVEDVSSSEVTRSMIAMTASHRLMSENDIGKFISEPQLGCRKLQRSLHLEKWLFSGAKPFYLLPLLLRRRRRLLGGILAV